MQRIALLIGKRVILLLVCLLVFTACADEPRVLSIDEYLLLNQQPPLWLVGIDLAGADLRGVDLSNAELRGTDFREANLRGANLSGANLLFADLRGADLTNANLRGAKLNGTNFSATTLSNINVTEAEYTNATRWPVDFDAIAAGAILR